MPRAVLKGGTMFSRLIFCAAASMAVLIGGCSTIPQLKDHSFSNISLTSREKFEALSGLGLGSAVPAGIFAVTILTHQHQDLDVGHDTFNTATESGGFGGAVVGATAASLLWNYMPGSDAAKCALAGAEAGIGVGTLAATTVLTLDHTRYDTNIHLNTWRGLELSSSVGAVAGALFGYWWCSPGAASGPIDLASIANFMRPAFVWHW
jgi:hypothetical protein